MKYFRNFPQLEYDGQVLTNLFRRGKIRDVVRSKINLFYNFTIEGEMRPDQIAYQYYDTHDTTWSLFYTNNVIDPIHDWLLSYQEFVDYMNDKYQTISPKEAKMQIGTLKSANVTGDIVTFDSSVRYTPIKVLEIIQDPDNSSVLRRVEEVLDASSFRINAPFNENKTNREISIYTDTHSYYNEEGFEIDYDTWLSLPDTEKTRLSFFEYEVMDNESKRTISLIDTDYIDQVERELSTLFDE